MGERQHRLPLVAVWIAATWPVVQLMAHVVDFTRVDRVLAYLLPLVALGAWVVAPRHVLKAAAVLLVGLWVVYGLHEVPSYAVLSLALLAAWAIVAGWVAVPWWSERSGGWGAAGWVVVSAASLLVLLPDLSGVAMPKVSSWLADANASLVDHRFVLVLGLLGLAFLVAWALGGRRVPVAAALGRAGAASDRAVLGPSAALVGVVRRVHRWQPPRSSRALDPGDGPRWDGRPWWGPPLAVWATVQTVVVAITLATGQGWRSWAQQDTNLYTRIAQVGPEWTTDRPPTVVAFPLYGLLIRWVEPIAGDHVNAALVVSLLAGLALVLAYWRWMLARDLGRSARWCGAVLFAAYPYAFFCFGIGYGDGLFTALAITTFLLLELDRPVWAGVVGALATAARPTGLALIAGLVVVLLERLGVIGLDHPFPNLWRARPLRRAVGWGRDAVTRARQAPVRPRHLAVLLCSAGFLAYAAWCWRTFDDPIAFWTAQRWYGHGTFFAPATWGKEYYVTTVLSGEWNGFSQARFVGSVANTLFMTALLGLVVACLPAVRRRFGLGYAVFLALIVLQTWVGATNMGATGRYLVPAFPLFALGGEWLAGHPVRQRAVIIPSALLAGLFLWLFMVTAGIPSW